MKKANAHSRNFAAATLVILALFSSLTIGHSCNFRDRFSLWKNVVSTSPHFSFARLFQAQLYFFGDRIAEAEQECLKGIELAPDDPVGFHVLGAIYASQRRYKEAQTAYRKEIEADPKQPNPQAYVNLGFVYFLDGKFNQAEKAYLECIKLNPLQPEVHSNLGAVCLATNRYKAAEIEYKNELEIDPSDDVALHSLGLIYARQNRWEKAANFWTQAVAANPDNQNAWRKLFDYALRFKKNKQAVYYFDEIQKVEGGVDPRFLKRLVQI